MIPSGTQWFVPLGISDEGSDSQKLPGSFSRPWRPMHPPPSVAVTLLTEHAGALDEVLEWRMTSSVNTWADWALVRVR